MPKLENRQATVAFTVTNTATSALNGTLLVRPTAPAPAEWLTLVGAPTRPFLPKAVQQVQVAVKVPPDAPSGALVFLLDAMSEANPDEDYTEGPAVSLDVPEPDRTVPWWRRYWWVFVIAAVVIAGIVLAVVLLTAGGNEETKILKRTISSLESDAPAWRATIASAAGELDEAGSETAASVKVIQQDATAQAAAAGCDDTYVGDRLADKLRVVLHDVDPDEAAPALVPVVCRTDPPGKADSETTGRVSYFGFDLQKLSGQKPFGAELRYQAGGSAIPSLGSVAAASATELRLPLAGAGGFAGVDRDRKPEIVLRWNGADVQNTALPLTIPRRLTEEFDVGFRVDGPAPFGPPNCRSFEESHEVPAGWTIDQARGDQGHPGVSQLEVGDDDQGLKSLEKYRYEAASERVVKVSGNICGVWVGFESVPASFLRRYRVFLIRRD